MDTRILAAAGIDPELPAAQAAAELVRRMPLRRHAHADLREPQTAVESGWFAGAAECARVLGRVFRGSTGRGTAFASSWPLLEAGGVVVAPGLPVAAEASELDGPDGAYQLARGTVWRESVGERRAVLSLAGDGDKPTGTAFDLLWFGSSERYLLRDGTLEVDDLFARLTVRPHLELLERLLVRARRVEPAVLEGVAAAGREAPPAIEVRRPLALAAGTAWQDPLQVLGVRADIVKAERRGDEVIVQTGRGTTVVFRLAEKPRAWTLFTWEGEYPFRTLALAEAEGHLRLTATLGPALDPWSPGVRGRIAFDLRSDLVALGKKGEKGTG